MSITTDRAVAEITATLAEQVAAARAQPLPAAARAVARDAVIDTLGVTTLMILVRSGWLWCSLCVRGNGIRIETIRFGLLIVLTVALASVALRIGSHSHPTSSGRPAHNLTPIPSPSGRPTSPRLRASLSPSQCDAMSGAMATYP